MAATRVQAWVLRGKGATDNGRNAWLSDDRGGSGSIIAITVGEHEPPTLDICDGEPVLFIDVNGFRVLKEVPGVDGPLD